MPHRCHPPRSRQLQRCAELQDGGVHRRHPPRLAPLPRELGHGHFPLLPGTEITTDIVEKYIGISKEYNIFELQNALAARDLNKVYKITYNFCNHLKENPNPATINGLASFYGKMLAFHLSDRSAESLTKIFGNLPPFILQTKAQEANRFSIFELKRNISLLREYDAKCKGVNSVLEDAELLKELIYSLTH